MNKWIVYPVLLLVSLVALINLFWRQIAANTSSSFQVTLTGLHVDRAGDSSRYRITNLSVSEANLHQAFFADADPASMVASWVGGLQADVSMEMAIDAVEQLPDGFQGFVIISSNQLITATFDLNVSPTPAVTLSPTPAVTASPTPAAPTQTLAPTSTPDPNEPTATSTPLWQENGTPVPLVRLDALQKNRNAPSSRFQITNQSANMAIFHLHFFAADGTLLDELGDSLAANATVQYDLANLTSIPSNYRGYVTIDASRQIAATLLPVADFFATKQEGNPPFTVHFSNHSLGDYTASSWDFGDGHTSTETNPSHTYAITGTYSVALTVTSPDGADTATKSNLINVHAFPATHTDGWDLNFGNYGRLDIEHCSWLDAQPIVHHQSDGKILMALECYSSSTHELYVLRYTADGAVDITFGENGYIRLPDGPLSAFNVQNDNRFIVVSGLTLYRFFSDGMPDTTFGLNGAAIAFPTATEGLYTQSAVQADGKIVAVGRVENQRLIARYNPNGTLDTTFNGQGYLLQAVTNDDASDPDANSWRALAVQPDGKIVVARSANKLVDPFNQTYATTIQLQRFIANGSPDPIFGSQGTVELAGDQPQIALQSTGHILVYDGANDQLLRLLPLGTVDNAFAADQYGEYYQLQVDAHDRILAIGGFTPQLSVVRLSADGTFDTNFGQDGTLRQPDGTFGFYFIAEQSGNVLLGVLSSAHSGPTVVRYLDDHPAPPPATQPLALLYAVLDNNLGDSWTRLVNNVEAGTRTGMHVRLLVDGPTDNDVYVYDIMQDHNPFCPSPANPTCDGRYAEGVNFQRLSNENSAHPDSLYQFLVDAYAAYPATDKIVLSLIGHGSGWSANVLPGQPSVWRDQSETIGGMLWDDHPTSGEAESRSLNYNELLPTVVEQSRDGLGLEWLQLEAARLRSNPGYPFTLTLFELGKMDDVANATTAFSDALRTTLPGQRDVIVSAFRAAGRFDSDYNGVLEEADAYTDLHDFVAHIQTTFAADDPVLQASQALSTSLAVAVVAKDAEGGAPWISTDQLWQWPNYGGVGVYLPLAQDETRRQLFYNQNNLAWSADTTWDEFLADYWAAEVMAAKPVAEMPVCHATVDGCVGLANPLPVQDPPIYSLYLPLLYKE